jgi:hypothetical protein
MAFPFTADHHVPVMALETGVNMSYDMKLCHRSSQQTGLLNNIAMFGNMR